MMTRDDPFSFWQFGSRADIPLVEMQVADEWTKPEQAVVRYRTSSAFHRSSWDWIALYRVRRAGRASC